MFPEPVFETGASACSATRARVRCSADYSRGRAYTAHMASKRPTAGVGEPERAHLDNVVANLQLVADMGYGDVALAVPEADGTLVVARRRAAQHRRRAHSLPAASAARSSRPTSPRRTRRWRRASRSPDDRRRVARGITYTTSAWPIGGPAARTRSFVRDLAEQVAELGGRHGGRLHGRRRGAARRAAATARSPTCAPASRSPPCAPRATASCASVPSGTIAYASPNAVNIMRLAGVDAALAGMQASALPGGGFGIAPVLGTRGGIAVETRGRRAGARLPHDRPARRRARARRGPHRGAPPRAGDQGQGRHHPRSPPSREEQPADHRVAAAHPGAPQRLRRGPPRACRGDRARRFDGGRARAARGLRRGARRLRRGRRAPSSISCAAAWWARRIDVVVAVEGQTGEVDAHTATSLALALAELVHNALEHGIGDRENAAGSSRRDAPGPRRAGAHRPRRRRRPARWLRGRSLGAISGSRSCAPSSRTTCAARSRSRAGEARP